MDGELRGKLPQLEHQVLVSGEALRWDGRSGWLWTCRMYTSVDKSSTASRSSSSARRCVSCQGGRRRMELALLAIPLARVGHPVRKHNDWRGCADAPAPERTFCVGPGACVTDVDFRSYALWRGGAM